MMEKLSNRILALAESETLVMAQKAREFKERGVDIISLSLGEPDFKTPKHICEAAKQAIDEGKYFTYPPVAGYTDLREAIAEKLRRDNNLDWAYQNIVVSTGAKQSIANVFLSLLNPGDEVIILAPYWVTYSEIVKLAEGVPVFVKGNLNNNYKATADQIADAITSKTRMMIFSSPSNPTGSVFTEEELRQIADVLKDKNILVISDEIYEYINFTGKKFSIGSIPEMKEKTITVNGFSKGFAMTGWRVGYIAAPLFIAKACNKMQGQITSATNSIAQRAALAALKSDFGPTKEMAAAYLKRRDLAYDLLNEIPGVKNYKPAGAFYFFPDFSSYFGKSAGDRKISNSGDLVMYFLEEAHVSSVSGDAFGSPENIRLSYAASEAEIVEAIRRIKEALAKLS
ncbi:MAG TPA: pyridoxal phosphate-dependent aminotransferase [Cyclobacteriaceae bacterium]